MALSRPDSFFSVFSPRVLCVLLVSLCLAPLWSASVGAQTASVLVAENFRAEPNGTVVATLEPGTEAVVLQRRGSWVEIEVEGWVWIRSLQVTDQGGFDLVVAMEGGENLRLEPQGRVLAELVDGALLEEVERIPGWIRARRAGWIWAPSVEIHEGDEGPGPTGMDEVADEPVTPSASVSAPPGSGSGRVTLPSAVVLLTSPEGDTLARTRPDADVELLARQGNWARVRLEGWAWMPTDPPSATQDREALTVVATPVEVRDDPDRFRGRIVTWDLQFVSRERAERIRTDFLEGEPYLLTRMPDGRGVYVYVTVPPERLAEVEGLVALERVRVTGRVRTGRSTLTGNPIVDLIEIRRGGEG